MTETIHVTGLAELNQFLQDLPIKIEKNILRGSLRAGMNTIKPVAQQNVHSVSGELAAGLKVGTKAKGGTVTASLKATGPHAFIAHMLEFTGAKAHQIKSKDGGALAFGGGVYQSVQHPGFQKRPFMRPALDQQATVAVVAAAEYMKNRLATKEGLDTAGIVIEGDV
jgi:HK97 gp10 family phage protein